MELWKLCFIILAINLAGAFGERCIIEKKGNLTELRSCHVEDLKFDKVDDVKEMTANNNNFPNLNYSIFGKFQKLESLSLKQCNISGISPDAFQGLTKLKKLYLNENELMELDERVFEPLENLEKLYLDANQIKTLDKDLLKHNRNLKVLSLDFNQISFLNDELLFNLEKLEQLSIQENEMKTLNSKIFQENMRLNRLNLKNNKIFAIERDSFQHLKELKYLNLEGNICINKTFGNFHLKVNFTEVTQDLELCQKINERYVESWEPKLGSILIMIILLLALIVAIICMKMRKNRNEQTFPMEMNQLQRVTQTGAETNYLQMNSIKCGLHGSNIIAGRNLLQIKSADHEYATIQGKVSKKTYIGFRYDLP
jgi:hypothetical protein